MILSVGHCVSVCLCVFLFLLLLCFPNLSELSEGVRFWVFGCDEVNSRFGDIVCIPESASAVHTHTHDNDNSALIFVLLFSHAHTNILAQCMRLLCKWIINIQWPHFGIGEWEREGASERRFGRWFGSSVGWAKRSTAVMRLSALLNSMCNAEWSVVAINVWAYNVLIPDVLSKLFVCRE